MAIAPPAWAKDAIPTVRGWVSPKGELLKSQKISQAEVDAWGNGNDFVVESAPEPAPQQLNEAPANQKGLEDYSRSELQELGNQHGIELKGSKATMVQDLEEHLLSE